MLVAGVVGVELAALVLFKPYDELKQATNNTNAKRRRLGRTRRHF